MLDVSLSQDGTTRSDLRISLASGGAIATRQIGLVLGALAEALAANPTPHEVAVTANAYAVTVSSPRSLEQPLLLAVRAAFR